MQGPAFITKVCLPKRRPDILRRSRLIEFLHQHVDRRLILLCAGPGYGKTTLLADFAADVDLPVCWYSLDASDADPRTFFEYLLLSLRQRFPQFGERTESLLASAEDLGKDVRSLVASLIGEIQSEIEDYFLVVLDDTHWLDGSEIVESALDLMLQHIPDNCHLVLASRSLPRLSFSRLAAQRQVAGLGMADLRFTSEELGELLRESYKLAMPPARAEELIDLSEGWITGILLSTHTPWMGMAESIANTREHGTPLFDYLASEVFLHQPDEVQHFLLCSSVLDRLSPERCDRLCCGGASADTLRQLVAANLFIVQLEGPGEWYRYHNLFQDFLQARLRATDPALHSRLHRAAAEMAECEGDWDGVVRHYQVSGDVEAAADFVEKVSEGMVKSGRWRTLSRWLDSLPSSAIDARPRLSLHRGYTYIWSSDLDKAIPQLDRALEQCRLKSDLELAARVLNLKSIVLRMKGRVDEALAATAEAVALHGDRNCAVAAETHRERGICLASLGKPAEAAAEMERAIEVYRALGDRGGEATTCQSLGLLAVRTGELAQGMTLYQQALGLWGTEGNPTFLAGILNCIASVHHETGEYSQALSVAEEALSRAREAGYLRSEGFALATLGDVQRDSGDLQKALESYNLALNTAQQIDDNQLTNYLLDALAAAYRMRGEYATAERLQRQAIQQAKEHQSPSEAASFTVSAAVLAEEQGDRSRAESLLRSAIKELAAFGARRDMARARFHLARVLFSTGRQKEAREQLEGCLELCRQLGYDRFMVVEGRRAVELLSWAVAQGIGGRRLELALEALRDVRPQAPVARTPMIRIASSDLQEIQAYSLGKARVVVDGHLVTSSEWAVEKTKELFFYLMGQPYGVRKEQIVDALWPDLDLGKCSSQFHSTMYRLRRAITRPCVVFRDGRYQFTAGKSLWIDAEEFTQLLDEAESVDLHPESRIQLYQRALGLYQGSFLEEFYSDWVVRRREELEQRYLQAATRLARLRARGGELEQAAELLRSALAVDPYREETHYALIHYTALLGDRAAALRHYKHYARLLRDELGAEPNGLIVALAERIALGHQVPSA